MTIQELESFRFRFYYKIDLKQRLYWLRLCSNTSEIKPAEQTIMKGLLRIESLENELTVLICGLPEAWQPVIEKRYMFNMSWPTVAKETGYSHESVIRINRELVRWLKSGKKGNWRM